MLGRRARDALAIVAPGLTCGRQHACLPWAFAGRCGAPPWPQTNERGATREALRHRFAGHVPVRHPTLPPSLHLRAERRRLLTACLSPCIDGWCSPGRELTVDRECSPGGRRGARQNHKITKPRCDPPRSGPGAAPDAVWAVFRMLSVWGVGGRVESQTARPRAVCGWQRWDLG